MQMFDKTAHDRTLGITMNEDSTTRDVTQLTTKGQLAGSSPEIAGDLCRLIHPSRVLARYIDRVAFSSDASFYRLIPRVVVQPSDLNEVRRLFEYSRIHKVPLTFRAGGTSLSGQAITDGILVDVARYWRLAHVEEGGRLIRAQPGVIGQHANHLLRAFGRKIGPDPASINVARLGGILSNNASGMCCGVSKNAYHTLRAMTFMLPSGTEINTAASDADIHLKHCEPQLVEGLLEQRRRIRESSVLAKQIRSKYQRKNTVGYSLNAFLDFESPVAILSHLLIGAEGTLGFIAEAVLESVPDPPVKYTGFLLFPDLYAACAAIVPLRDTGAAAIELMDCASLRTMKERPEGVLNFYQMPHSTAALLVEFQMNSVAERIETKEKVREILGALNLVGTPFFTENPREQENLWSVRKGLFPSVGAVRATGTTVIIEDVAVPVERLADASVDLTELFKKYGYKEAVLFGHAKDGNLHFVLSQGFRTNREVYQYEKFIEDVVKLVLHKYDGTVKAEHGTGRNMAPFVEMEWGGEAFEIMKRLKHLVDPENLLNPGVIINSDPQAHISNLKSFPTVETVVDKCIECGYCEPICPSRDLTLTPRQRIVVWREMRKIKDERGDQSAYDALSHDFSYMGLETCAVDGLCATTCPVRIDTGELTKRLRQTRHSATANRLAAAVARNFTFVEHGTRFVLGSGHAANTILGRGFMRKTTRLLDAVSRALIDEQFWKWGDDVPRPRRSRLPIRSIESPDAILFPSCISRVIGEIPGEEQITSLTTALLTIVDRAGRRLYLPKDVIGKCCGVPFSSKGFEEAYRIAVNRTVESMFSWSQGGALPVVVDTSPCSYGLKSARAYLSPENQGRFDKLVILDSIEYVAEQVLPRLPIYRKTGSIAVHPVCSLTNMGITSELIRVCKACSDEVVLPRGGWCCAFAGDRGFLFPELTASATKEESVEINLREFDGYFSSSRMCEIGMMRATGRQFRSYVHLLDYVSRPPAEEGQREDAHSSVGT